MEKREIKENDLVTIQTTKYNTASNTYRVYRKFEGSCILTHPLAPECYIIRKDEDLNNVQAVLPNSLERCLYFAKQNQELLSHSSRADLEAMIYFFVIKKDFTPKQRTDLAAICGRVAAVKLHSNTAVACETVTRNIALLDDHFTTMYNNFEKVIKKPSLLKTKTERYSVFNLAGFVMAQLGEDGENE